MYCMYGMNIPENRLHETVDNLLACLDQLFRRLSVDLSEGRRMSCRPIHVLLPALVEPERNRRNRNFLPYRNRNRNALRGSCSGSVSGSETRSNTKCNKKSKNQK
jgi:hypothetical protein